MSHWRIHPVLPIFAVSDGLRHVLYIPGHIMPAKGSLVHDLQVAWATGATDVKDRQLIRIIESLTTTATAVQNAWTKQHAAPFVPVCLNVQLPYACNQSCVYCYTREIRQPARLDRRAIAAATRIVVANCASQCVPLQVDIQGLGEPTLCWEDLQWCVAHTSEQACAAGVPWSGHLSTGGQFDPALATWIGEHFTHMTVSCDGPPDIQDACRPRKDGRSASNLLAASIVSLASANMALEARVTITSANCTRLPEVVEFIARDLAISAIRLEPIFFPFPSAERLPDPEVLAEACLDACSAGSRFGVDVTIASPDLLQLHGEYCQAARQTLRVLPDGTAINCLHGSTVAQRRSAIIGRYVSSTDQFLLDHLEASHQRAMVGDVPSQCRSCLNVYHCTRSCPDSCPEDVALQSTWRCRFQRHLAERWVLQAENDKATAGKVSTSSCLVPAHLREELHAVESAVDRACILAASLAATKYYDLENSSIPRPPWEDSSISVTAEDAADLLMQESRCRSGPLSIYVHIPYCRKRCVFCDCHSLGISRSRKECAAYVQRLLCDLDYWCEHGGIASRPVTTIHFGGGTPTVLGAELLNDIVKALRERLGVNDQTEWALETTSEGSTPQNVEHLLALGFRRLHVGVQTLDDAVRRRLGRVSSAGDVLERLRAAMAQGLVVSVDLLYGLPEQSVRSLLDDIGHLCDIGIHGLSLYRLNLSSKNRGLLKVFDGFQPRALRACVMLQAAERALVQAGYRKNHYVHYALPQDTNMYYRHAARGEDMVGFGASASGMIGPWEYRCAFNSEYLAHIRPYPAVFALAKNRFGNEWARLSAEMMAGATRHLTLPPDEEINRLMTRWLMAGLLTADTDQLRVTATGSWLMNVMLEELNQVDKLERF